MPTYHLVKFGWPAEFCIDALRRIALQRRLRHIMAIGH